MSVRHLVDPEFLNFVDTDTGIAANAERLDSSRQAIVQMFAAAASPDALPCRVAAAPRTRGSGSVPLRIFQPKGELRLRPAILELHGGGFVLGEACISDAQNRALADEHDAVVVSVDYRLAPECPFPGPLEDCYTGLVWLFAHAKELRIDPARVILFGASAGGGLAAALALLARDRGEYRLAAQFLIYPMLDYRTGTDDDLYNNPVTGEFGWRRADNRFGWQSMRGSAPIKDSDLGYFSPSLADRLEGLAPAFLAVGALDLFVDEDIAYATRLNRAGVATELHVYPGVPHGFNLVPGTEMSRQFNAALSSALRSAFNR
jgi:acetyl esterase